MHVLVTGGAGFIGSHAALRLLDEGHRVTVVDNLVRGHREAATALERLAPDRFRFVECDLLDTDRLAAAAQGCDLAMHFAALAYVGESVDEPLRYYRNNVGGTISLLDALTRASVRRLVFSSTCATYGEPSEEYIPISENCPQHPVNAYGRSKLMCEAVIRDWSLARTRASAPVAFAFLRYFNVAGSDATGRVGEDHRPETHLIPICLEVALGQRPSLTVFGEDWPTPDSTCIRDYVHVEDLISAHVLVAQRLDPDRAEGREFVFNVGTGRGASVREVLDSCRRVTGHAIPAIVGQRRAGDPPRLVGSPEKIRRELGWSAKHVTLDTMVASAWAWRQAHPKGW
ncbi:MAG: UDP-glucose 4-epimerase GalE [Phycisphaerae bacterium]|jgi:UDP-glucose 4-epimerase|nr:UDP-glucose 4-epimerase GalE [Phycisphaerae bacterium]